MVFILILAADTRNTAQGASIERAIQLPDAVSTGAHRWSRRQVCCCAAGGVHKQRSKQGDNVFPAVEVHISD